MTTKPETPGRPDDHEHQPDPTVELFESDAEAVTVDEDETAEPPMAEAEIAEGQIVDAVSGIPRPQDLGLELPDDHDAAKALLLRELLEARQEASEYLETLQRIAADFENYRKRVERDQAENVLRASQRIVEALLPGLDSFDAALGYEPQTPAEEKLLDGMRSTHSQLIDTLEREGVAPIEAAPGTPFDPAVHEAVAGGGDGDLVVANELRRGYTLRSRVLRPSLVTVEAKD